MTPSQDFFDNRSYCGQIRREFKKVKTCLFFSTTDGWNTISAGYANDFS